MSMTASRARSLLAAVLVALVAVAPAHAGLFDDDEARRAILDLRKQLEQSNEQARARQNEQMVQMSAQIDQLKRSLLDLNGTIDAQRADNAKLRGQMEELARVVAEVQRKQADIVQGVDERIRRVEPQKVSVDDKEFSVDAEEKRSYDDALAGFRKGEFDRAATGFSGLLKRFPIPAIARRRCSGSAMPNTRSASTRRRSRASAVSSSLLRRARARPRRCWRSPTARPS